MVVAFLGAPAGLVFDCLFLEMIESFADGGRHVASLSQSDEGAVARGNGDLGLVTVLFDGEDDLGFKLVAEDLADFG